MSRNKQSEEPKKGVRLKEIIDTLASGQVFTTYEEILTHLGGECLEYGSISDSPDYKYLKCISNENVILIITYFHFERGVAYECI